MGHIEHLGVMPTHYDIPSQVIAHNDAPPTMVFATGFKLSYKILRFVHVRTGLSFLDGSHRQQLEHGDVSASCQAPWWDSADQQPTQTEKGYY